jgi:hypothetical protein
LAAYVPEEALRKLEVAYYHTAAMNLRFQSELRRVLLALQGEGIPTIVLKGAALAETVYSNAALRPMRDLDILVEEHNLARADSIIRSFGYASQASDESQERTRRAHRHYPELAGPDGVTVFEAHRHIVRADSLLQFDIADFWARAGKATIAGVETLILSPEDCLTHLCLSFFLDRRFRSVAALRQLVDISELVLHYQDSLDRDYFAGHTLRHGLAGPIFCALLTCQRLLGTSPPTDVLSELRPRGFDLDMMDLVIDRRVLGLREWAAHDLVSPGEAYTLRNTMKSAFTRLFPGRSLLEERYRRLGTAGRPLPLLYWQRLMELSRLAVTSLISPRDLGQDLLVDRWMHSLRGQG